MDKLVLDLQRILLQIKEKGEFLAPLFLAQLSAL
jgi:hypothetical protein